MDTTCESKKYFCARCFLPVDPEDKIDIEGQNFHRICSMCCVCRTIPTSLKMFCGHVFCASCFKMCRLRAEARGHPNSWWTHWTPPAKPAEASADGGEEKPQTPPDEAPKRSICARCLQPVAEGCKVQIGAQSFHTNCAQCYFCHTVPTSNVKIYYGQVFCEACFHRFVLNKNRDNPSDFFRSCFETWQNNAQFAENMRDFMSGSSCTPLVFMMQGGQQPFCRCGTGGPQEWFSPNESKKSATATPCTSSVDEVSTGTVELSMEYRTEASEARESSAVGESANQENLSVDAAEKIEKLTKYLHETDGCSLEKYPKKWKNFIELDEESSVSDVSYFGWMDLQDSKVGKREMDCPKCLWQCGPIFVTSDYLKRQVACAE